MGAEVIKVEAPDKPDTGRVSELHEVLGQSKLALSIDLKAAGALDAVRRLVEHTDVVVENFATGVMERLGLGYDALRALRPEIILLSASGLGRTGPGAEWVAYGNLLSAYSGFAALNDPTDGEPRTGLAWADPLCGLFMAFAVVAALRQRDQGGGGRHINFSMLEGLLWTMPGALLTRQLTGVEAQPTGNDHPIYAPHGVFRCAGEDRWLAVAVTDDAQWRALCRAVPALHDLAALAEVERRSARDVINTRLAAWARNRDDIAAMEMLQSVGVPAAASYTTNDLFADAHLWDRGFYQLVHERDGTERFLRACRGDGATGR
jgi:crotonobetainyl-CoA:carnitine CoA-transferase CaiB-like acyl-CoA transferase